MPRGPVPWVLASRTHYTYSTPPYSVCARQLPHEMPQLDLALCAEAGTLFDLDMP